jgi:RNA polymerase sigma-70 factor, ECF subfamily
MTQPHEGSAAASLAEMLEERKHLLEIGLQIFGSAVTADRIVQETYRRWYALDDDERAAIAVPRAWLTRVARETCLELLSSADPAQPPSTAQITRVDRCGAVQPPEPRQTPKLHTRPQQQRFHPQDLTAQMVDLHARAVRRFAAACESGDIAELEMLLGADAVVVIDGGGKVRAAIRPLHGTSEAARHVAALLAGQPCTIERVNDREGLVLRRAGRVVAVVSLNVTGAEVTRVWIVLNPDKLRNWHTTSERPTSARPRYRRDSQSDE